MNKYAFDPNSLKYEQVENDLRSKILKILTGVSALAIGFIIIIIYSMVFDTPRERELRQENEALYEDYEFLSQKYAKVDTVLQELRSIDRNIYQTIFETLPLSEGDLDGTGYTDYRSLLNTNNASIIMMTAFGVQEILNNARVKDIEYEYLHENVSRKALALKTIPAIQPVVNPDFSRLASGYGNRLHPFYKIVKFHQGIDFTVPAGSDVFATADGKVKKITRTHRGKGNTIIIDHGNGYETVYCHLDEFRVREGRNVERGQVIATVGNTGLSVAPHLHYEVLLKGETVNPVNYFFLELSPKQYNQIIDISLKSGQSFD